MSDVTVSEGCKVLSPESRKIELPYMVTLLVLGAVVMKNYKGQKDTVVLEIEDNHFILSEADYEIADKIAQDIKSKIKVPSVMSAKGCIDLFRLVSSYFDKVEDSRAGKRGIVMLKDRFGSGFWRMVYPARYMDTSDCFIDITSAGVTFNELLNYDTICVQRLHDWESYYFLDKLKRAGKYIVYEIDDDIFNIDESNPARRLIGRDEQLAAIACMKLSDKLVVPTLSLQNVIKNATDGLEAVIIPNGIDMSDNWVHTPLTGSLDGIKRIFWQGGDTHGEDWLECIDAIDAIICERKDVRLVILGYLPPILYRYTNKPDWKGKVEFLEFRDIETYFQIIKHIRAEVGIAPLRQTIFNQSKSPLKFIEYSAIGIPTVASDVKPYSETIRHDVNGLLAKTSDEWYKAILTCLHDSHKRVAMIAQARYLVNEEYSIQKIAKKWDKVLKR